MTTLTLALELTLGATFAAAAISKARRPAVFARALQEQLIVPAGAVPLTAIAVTVAEALVAFSFLSGVGVIVGIPLAYALLAAFAVAVVVNLLRDRTPPCGCFGTGEAVSWLTLMRIILLSGVVSAVAASRAWGVVPQRHELSTVLAAAGVAAAFAAAWALLSLLVRLGREFHPRVGVVHPPDRSGHGI